MAIMLTVVLTCVPFAPFERPKDIELLLCCIEPRFRRIKPRFSAIEPQLRCIEQASAN